MEKTEKDTTSRIRENELYQEIDLINNGNRIGIAEIDIKNNMLSRFEIFEPYQNKGCGTRFLKMLIEKYDINILWVEDSNKRAIHVYEKCGFKIISPTMHKMERRKKLERKEE